MNGMKFFAKGWQSARLGLDVARIIRSQNLTAKEMREIRKNKTLLSDYTEKMVSELLDPWFIEKRKISIFFQTCFKDKLDINWDKITIPIPEGNLKRLDFFPIEKINEDDILEAHLNFFGENSAWKEWNDKLTNIINYKTTQPRPGKNYFGLHIGGEKPDILGKNYDDAILEDIICMTPFEYLISSFRYCFETWRMYDVKEVTRLSSFDRFGYAMIMFGDIKRNRLSIISRSRTDYESQDGLRRIKIVHS